MFVNVYDTEVAFSIPYGGESIDDAIFEIRMTAFELTDCGNFVVNNPQDGLWESLGEEIDISKVEKPAPDIKTKKWWQFW